MGTAAASALIAACGRDKPVAAPPPPPTATAAPGMDTAVAAVPVGWAGPRGELLGRWAQAATRAQRCW